MQKLTSSDHYNVAVAVTRRLYEFMQDESCEFPVTVVIVGANNSVIARASIPSLAEAGDTRCWNSVDPFAAQFPVTAIITNAKGDILDLTFTREYLLQ